MPNLCKNLLLVAALLPGWLLHAAGHAEPVALSYTVQSLEIHGQERVVRLPSGWRLELLSDALQGPRIPTFADNGELFIGSRSGAVYRFTPPYNKPQTLVTLPGYPHSVALRDGEILIAMSDGLYRAPYRAGQANIDAATVRLLAALPGGAGHSSRSVAIGPDERVYVSLGISGNCSDHYLADSYPFAARRGGILVLDETAAVPRWKTFASGLRNPVGFAWHPQTRVMYASNNGPDHRGYQQPPEYFSRVTAGSFHGMPWFQFDGETLQRDTCIRRRPPRPMGEVTLPVATFPARNAPMGVSFVADAALGGALTGDAIVALHGSWGTQPAGGAGGDPATRRPPKLVAVRFAGGEARRVDDLLSGFQLPNGERWARPVGVALGPDGALYFTSDSGINGLFRLKVLSPSE